jgi:GNAT superfamily N-acetyltransferase
MLQFVPAETETQYRQIRELIVELTEWDTAQAAQLGLDADEVRNFYYPSGEEAVPGVYSPPEGRILLAIDSTKAAGCGAFHRMTPEICELNRMYVRPQFRRLGIGRQLAGALIVAAREAGYGTYAFGNDHVHG